MRFQELASVVAEYPKNKSRLLIIIPFFTEYEYLFKHLTILSKQTFRDFNAVIVCAKSTDTKKVSDYIEKTALSFGVVVAQTFENSGGSGGFFTGQLYALEKGYSNMILADVDCFPLSNDVVELIWNENQNDAVYPLASLYEGDRLIEKCNNVTMYGMLSSNLVKKIGLIYFPMYQGGDDKEYRRRINAHTKVKTINAQVEHRVSHSSDLPFYFVRPNYFLNGILFDKFHASQVPFIFSLYVGRVFFSGDLKRSSRYFLACLLKFSFGKDVALSLKPNMQIIEPTDSKLSTLVFPSYVRDKGGILSALTRVLKAFRKDIIIEKTQSINVMAALAMMSRTAYFRTEKGQTFMFADNKNLLIYLLKILVFLIVLPLFIFLYFPAYNITKILRHPKTLGFGI